MRLHLGIPLKGRRFLVNTKGNKCTSKFELQESATNSLDCSLDQERE